MPLFSVIVLAMPWNAAVKAVLVGFLTVGGPEIVALLSIAILGKECFDLLAGKVYAGFKQLTRPGAVSKLRYRIGLVMFLLPVVPTYIQGYAPHLLPDSSPMRLYVNIGADVMFLTSLFLLGGDFWNKLRSLFIYEARAEFPPGKS
jgi:hypothetical protein